MTRMTRMQWHLERINRVIDAPVFMRRFMAGLCVGVLLLALKESLIG